MKETDLRRLIQSFVLSRIVYSLPYLHLQYAEREKVEGLIRQSHKSALHLPRYIATEKLLNPGIPNTPGEPIKAHKTAQMQRLAKSRTGQHILRELGISYGSTHSQAYKIPLEHHKKLQTYTIPKHMHPEHNTARRPWPWYAQCYKHYYEHRVINAILSTRRQCT